MWHSRQPSPRGWHSVRNQSICLRTEMAANTTFRACTNDVVCQLAKQTSSKNRNESLCPLDKLRCSTARSTAMKRNFQKLSVSARNVGPTPFACGTVRLCVCVANVVKEQKRKFMPTRQATMRHRKKHCHGTKLPKTLNPVTKVYAHSTSYDATLKLSLP